MNSSESSSSKPVFQTPQPNELQSEETREAVLERLADQQSQESEAIDPESTDSNSNPNAKDAAFLDNLDNLDNRHLPGLDTPPG
jgi:hypothetical protein